MGQVCHKHCPPEGGTALVLIGGAVAAAAVAYGVVQAITSAVFLTAAVVVLSAAIFAGVAFIVRERRRQRTWRPAGKQVRAIRARELTPAPPVRAIAPRRVMPGVVLERRDEVAR